MIMNLVRKILSSNGYMLLKNEVTPKGHFVDIDLKKILDVNRIQKIVDVGGYHGDMVHFFSTVFPFADWKVYEPTLANYEIIKNRFISNQHISVFNKGVGAKPGLLTFQKFDNGELNTFKQIQEEYRPLDAVEVEVVSLDQDLLDWSKEGIDFIKIDVEGFEMEVLTGMSHLLEQNKVGMVYIEVGFCKDDERHTDFQVVKNLLEKFGFSFFGLYDLYHYRKPTELLFSNALFLNEHYLQSKSLLIK